MSNYSTPSDFRIQGTDGVLPYAEIPSLHPLTTQGEFDTSAFTNAYTGLDVPWRVTEKVAGVSCRIAFKPYWRNFALGGRVLGSQLHPTAASALFTHLKTRGDYTVALKSAIAELKWAEATAERILVVCGECYGPGLGPSHNYNIKGLCRFSVTSVFLQGPQWYADWPAVEAIATALGFHTAPVLSESCYTDEALALLHGPSQIADEGPAVTRDGIIAFSDPFLTDRYGHPVCWRARSSNLTPLPI